MDVSILEIGTTYKNYKELCNVLGEPIKGGNTKKAQIKNWERYFKYEKEGNKFIVTHIYEIPLPENHNKTRYITTIQKLILDKIMHSKNDGHMFISKTELMKELRMINQNYIYAKYKQLRLAQHMNITIEEVEEFYLTSDDLLKRNIEAALNSLRSQSLIFWSHAITLCFIDTKPDTNINNQIRATKEEHVNEFGETEVIFSSTIPKSSREYRKATNDEIELILRVEREVLLKYKCESINDIFKRNLSKRFYKDVSNKLFDKANILFYFNSYEIVCNEEYILSKWEELSYLEMEADQREIEMDNLNKDIINRMNDNAKRRHEKSTMESVFGEVSKKIDMRTTEEYLTNNYRLTDTLINKDAKSIWYNLENIEKER